MVIPTTNCTCAQCTEGREEEEGGGEEEL